VNKARAMPGSGHSRKSGTDRDQCLSRIEKACKCRPQNLPECARQGKPAQTRGLALCHNPRHASRPLGVLIVGRRAAIAAKLQDHKLAQRHRAHYCQSVQPIIGGAPLRGTLKSALAALVCTAAGHAVLATADRTVAGEPCSKSATGNTASITAPTWPTTSA
jgi:hypothetical protein